MWTLYRLARLPRRPSDLIGLQEAGHSGRDCLAFDLMTLEFGERFERALSETVEKPMPADRRTPTMPAPKWGPADLERFLGLAEERSPAGDGEEIDQMVQQILRGEADWLG